MSGPSSTAGAGTGTATDAEQGYRRRDADASRAAILRAARRLLARRPYADITLKAVAERAGVSAPLIVKYFGNKERLFARVLSFEEDTDGLLDAPLEELGRHMVTRVLTSQAESNLFPLLRIVFAPVQSEHGDHGDTLRANFKSQVVARLTQRLAGPDAAVRAELGVGMLLGLGVVLSIVRGDAVRSAGITHLTDLYSPALQELLTGRELLTGCSASNRYE